MSGRARAPRRRLRPIPGWVRAAGWLLLLLGSLALVVWRQTHAVALEADLRRLAQTRAAIEAERVNLVRDVEALRSRARVLQVARDRLGMHLPADDEIVFLPVAVEPAADSLAGEAP